MKKAIDRDEILLKGHWLFKDGKVVKDKDCSRIEFLINEVLEKITFSSSGWLVSR